ncbi:hypothetical protein HRS9139_05376 [Pyrenophora teres f. teres]|nr:hypothetical protein HRS9139_05376 [Pyrenophora teres f. teres]KAE8849186.1 hypothetical protein HRS9122_03202 [Pyrenophora teres f. teres]CAE7032418.1 Cupin 1 domain containing protein [Pyrenophora teres f. teres]
MPIKVHTYTLPPTRLIPNSPLPLLHYPALLKPLVTTPDFTSTALLALYASNGWQTQWIARYGPDIQSHYHSITHEAMTVISGTGATIRFGVADSPSWEAGKLAPGERGDGEEGGVEIEAGVGDVFVVPAGVAHKTFAPRPETKEMAFWEPPRGIKEGGREKGEERRRFFEGVEVKGEFMMMGAYPEGNLWDFKVGGEHEGREGVVWDVPVPGRDPVLGESLEGLVGLWKGVGNGVSVVNPFCTVTNIGKGSRRHL